MFDLLDSVEQTLASSRISIIEFAESPEYCNPPEAPVWMADLSFKSMGEIKTGDRVVGWSRREDSGHKELCDSIVLDVQRRQAPIVKVTMESGRTFRCTPDHKWLTASFGGRTTGVNKNGEWYCPATPGRTLVHVIDPTVELHPDKIRTAAWLGGVFDGEGSCSRGRQITIAQSQAHNPDVHKAIGDSLDELGFEWVLTDRAYALKANRNNRLRVEGVNAATRQMVVNFVNWCKPVRWSGLKAKALKTAWRTKDKVVSVEGDGFGEVISLTTSTGNYIANGYASKNCDKNLYPRQRILLKLMFLEELEGWEEDVLNYWIAGGRGSSEIQISPNIRERTQFLRDRNYAHFREVALVGGRRSSKGFCTGIAAAKVLWDTLQLQDPGKHFGVDPKKEIYFSCVAASEDQAKQYQFADLINTVEGCKPIREMYWVKGLETEFRIATPADLRAQQGAKRNRGSQQRDIARLRGKAFAANAGTIRGSASMVIIFDEMAHMLETVEGKASASQVYSAAKPSLDQFGRAAMIFCNSSPYSKIGKFFERYTEAMMEFNPEIPLGVPDESGKLKGNGNPYMLGFQYPSWALTENYREEFRKYPSRYRDNEIPPGAFTVSPGWDPQEVDDEGIERYSETDKEQIQAMRVEEAGNPDTFKVERRGKFADVEDAYLNADMVNRMFAGAPTGYDEEGGLILNPLNTNIGQDTRVFYNYVAHLDPSSTTAGFGFALGHVEKFVHRDGSEEDHVVFDIIKRWQPQHFEGGAINWEVVLEEVLEYIEIFRPSLISYDMFQTDAPAQWLGREISKRNLETRLHLEYPTNERNWKRSETFKTALYRGLVHAPNDTIDTNWANLELRFLVKKSSAGKFPKVDKQDVGPVQTKDMADCIMEVTQRLIGNVIARNVREELASGSFMAGAQGGYQIGGTLGTKDVPGLSEHYSKPRHGEQNLSGRGGTQRRPVRAAVSSRLRGISRGR